jgi:Phytanoyl-CoA dioxygenase (PhyH)
LNLERDGAVRLERAVLSQLATLHHAVAEYPADKAGVRIFNNAALGVHLAADGVIGQTVSRAIGHVVRPVRAILFDKTAVNNWALGWHQDRTIAVIERHDVPGFGQWSIKGSVYHVEPPFNYMERMRTVRIHLDDVDDSNSPLLIALGTHRLGRIANSEINAVVDKNVIAKCHSKAGDIWLYATSILHASASSSSQVRRRVLQVDYADFDLPEPLQWRGI